MRILWASDAPWQASGYANQTRTMVPRLRELGHEIAIACFSGLEGAPIDWRGFRCYPRGKAYYSNDILAAHAHHFQADVLLTLVDTWVLQPENISRHCPWVAWFPIDSEPMPPVVERTVRQSAQPIVMSRFGQRMAGDREIETRYVPHGIDREIYKRRDKKEARTRFGIPQDRFVVGMVAANVGMPSRKAFAEQIAGYVLARARHPDMFLYLHTERGDVPSDKIQQVDILEILNHHGLEDGRDYTFVDSYFYALGLPDIMVSEVYSAIDVLLSVSAGEGFGLPIVEAQSCGTPVIVGDWTSMSELCGGGWMVSKRDAHRFYPCIGGCFQYLARPEAIAECLLGAYEGAGTGRIRDKALALAERYSADSVIKEHFAPALVELAKRLGV